MVLRMSTAVPCISRMSLFDNGLRQPPSGAGRGPGSPSLALTMFRRRRGRRRSSCLRDRAKRDQPFAELVFSDRTLREEPHLSTVNLTPGSGAIYAPGSNRFLPQTHIFTCLSHSESWLQEPLNPIFRAVLPIAVMSFQDRTGHVWINKPLSKSKPSRLSYTPTATDVPTILGQNLSASVISPDALSHSNNHMLANRRYNAACPVQHFPIGSPRHNRDNGAGLGQPAEPL